MGERAGEQGVDGEPPELMIVYYSAGADVNIHTTGRFPFVHERVPPANGVGGSGHAFVVTDMSHGLNGHLEIGCNTTRPENLQVTRSSYSAMQISSEGI